jgi:hypothetical protein
VARPLRICTGITASPLRCHRHFRTCELVVSIVERGSSRRAVNAAQSRHHSADSARRALIPPVGIPGRVEDVYSVIRRRRRGTVSATGLLIALTAFGVLSMHSVTATTSMSGGHAPMAAVFPVDNSIPVAFGEHRCPSVHQMMHPCAGTVTSWPASTAPTTSVGIEPVAAAADGIGGRTESTLGRAPPWAMWVLDKSVILRV